MENEANEIIETENQKALDLEADKKSNSDSYIVNEDSIIKLVSDRIKLAMSAKEEEEAVEEEEEENPNQQKFILAAVLGGIALAGIIGYAFFTSLEADQAPNIDAGA